MALRGPIIVIMVALAAIAVTAAQLEVKPNPHKYIDEDTTELLRIFGGDDVKMRDMFPFMVYINPTKFSGSRSYCGGSIIHRSWVMSAAHCFTDHSPDEDKDPEGFCTDIISIDIYAGLLNKDDRNDHVQKSTVDVDDCVAHLFIHPDYKKNAKHSSDVALIKLKTPFEFNDRVGSIDLAIETDFEEGKELTAMGWGRTSGSEDGDKPDQLQYVEGLKLISREDCRNEWFDEDSEKDRITDRNICFDGSNKNTCGGDSGSPVITRSRSSNKTVQMGIVSWVSSSGCPSDASSKPGVLVDVAKVSTWIDYTISDYWRPCEDTSDSCPRYLETGRCNEEKVLSRCRKSCTLCDCGYPWVSIRGQGCFRFVDERMNWDSARTYCQRKGGDLAVLEDKPKIASIVNYMECSGLWDDHHSQWLGANNHNGWIEYVFSWIDINNSFVEENLWKTFGSEQPDSGEDVCVYLYTKLSFEKNIKEDYELLSDTSCRTKKHFICEK